MMRIVLLLIALLSSPSLVISETAPPLKIGMVIALSGELSYFGKAFQQGAEMALKDGAGRNVALYYEDERSADRVTTLTATRSILGRHKPHVVIVNGMPNAIVVDSVAESSDVIVFSAWDSNKAIDDLGKNTYGFGWSNEKTGEDLARYAAESLKLKKVAVVTAHDEWSELISEAFEEKFKSHGGKDHLQGHGGTR